MPPLLFNYFLNDICDGMVTCKCLVYANDLKIFSAILHREIVVKDLGIYFDIQFNNE